MNHSDDEKLTGHIHQHLFNISKKLRNNNAHYGLDAQVFTLKLAKRLGRPAEIIASIKVDSPFTTDDDRIILLRHQVDDLASTEVTEEYVTQLLLHNAKLSASVDLYSHGSERKTLHVFREMLVGQAYGITQNRFTAFSAFSNETNKALNHIQQATGAFVMLTDNDPTSGWKIYPELTLQHFVHDVANITLARIDNVHSENGNYKIRYDLNLSFPVATLTGLKMPNDVTGDFIRDALLTATDSAIDAHTNAGETHLVKFAEELRMLFIAFFEKNKLDSMDSASFAGSRKITKI